MPKTVSGPTRRGPSALNKGKGKASDDEYTGEVVSSGPVLPSRPFFPHPPRDPAAPTLRPPSRSPDASLTTFLLSVLRACVLL